jgi:hypothetical protein
MPGQVPNNPDIYRIVHVQNVPYILQHGMFTRGHAQADPNYVDIGHQQLIGHRHIHPIPNFPHLGNLGDCVPFYFGTHSPMLFMIWKGLQGVQQRPQDEIVYIKSSIATIQLHNLTFVFTDMHAKCGLATGFNQLPDLTNIDWPVVSSRYWRNTETDWNKRDRKQAEFLVLHHVPVACIEEVIVRTQLQQTHLQTIAGRLNSNIPITLNASYYF